MELKRNLFLLNNDDLLSYYSVLSNEKAIRDFCFDECIYYDIGDCSDHTLQQAIDTAEDEIKSRMKREE